MIYCIWTDSQNNFSSLLFQRIQSISRWRTTQLDWTNPQQGSAAVVNIIVVVIVGEIRT